MRSSSSRRRGATCWIPARRAARPAAAVTGATQRAIRHRRAVRSGGSPQPRSLLPQGGPPGVAHGRQPPPALPAFAQPALRPHAPAAAAVALRWQFNAIRRAAHPAAAPDSAGRSSNSNNARWAMRSGGSRHRGATCCIPALSAPRARRQPSPAQRSVLSDIGGPCARAAAPNHVPYFPKADRRALRTSRNRRPHFRRLLSQPHGCAPERRPRQRRPRSSSNARRVAHRAAAPPWPPRNRPHPRLHLVPAVAPASPLRTTTPIGTSASA